MLGVTLPAVCSCVLAALHRTQALVDVIIVVACRSLVVRLAWFSLEALEQYSFKNNVTRWIEKQREAEVEIQQIRRT